ncbi:MAG: hypothetical protein LBP73_08480, partial [Clostridiales Family XIII bacterium]|nr:hypothetical protein [Clostridiales Family XIII bacterium]
PRRLRREAQKKQRGWLRTGYISRRISYRTRKTSTASYINTSIYRCAHARKSLKIFQNYVAVHGAVLYIE